MTTPFRGRRSVASALVVLATAQALACSTSSSLDTTSRASSSPALEGTYRAVTAGNIAEITFYEGDHYQLVNGVCADALLGGSAGSAEPSLAGCNESGTFALDAAGTTLTLSPTDGSPRSLPFHALLTAGGSGAATQGAGLHVQGGISLAGGDASLTSGTDASLVGDGGALIACTGTALSSSGTPLTQAFTAGGQSLVGGGQSSGSTPDPTQGGAWSCNGSYDTTISNAYYVTTFGCSSSSPAFQDPGDNCCGAGAPVAAAAGLCGSLKPATNCSNSCEGNSSCNSWRSNQSGATAASFKCEEMVNYFSTGAVAYGVGTRLCLSTQAGKGVVVFVYDDGPSCGVESRVDAHVLDVSPPTGQALFGESQIASTERKAIFVTTVSSSTPLGPNDSCASLGAGGSASPGSGGGSSGPGSSSPGGSSGVDGSASSSDAGCPGAIACKSTSDCNPSGPLGLVCVGGVCQSGCSGSSQCAAGMSCVTAAGSTNGVCQGAAGGQSCTNDGACNPGGNGAGLICTSGTCVAGCRASFECPGNTSCQGGQCR